ncbi:MAG: hypothetical protein JEZ06_16515 [Anaerolineaceae bacterium]|nr:hypothetical protein [Anaerolineaceae bacterium]
MEEKTKNIVIAAGMIAGALTGLAAAFIFLKQADKNVEETRITPRDGVKIGMGVFTLLRLVSDLNRE